MTTIEYFLDCSPTFYLLGLGIALRWIGSLIKDKYPRIAFFQFASSMTVLALYGLRRLVVNPPSDIVDAIEIFLRGGSFAMITFGIMGGLTAMYLLAREQADERTRAHANARQLQEARLEFEERQRRIIAEATANRPSQEEIDRQAERKKREREEAEATERQQRTEAAERRTLRLGLELEASEKLPTNKLKAFNTTLDAYLTDDADMSDFRDRIAMLREHINRQLESNTKHGFESLTEIESVFTEKQAEINRLQIHAVEKEALQSYLAKEKQATIHNFLKQESK